MNKTMRAAIGNLMIISLVLSTCFLLQGCAKRETPVDTGNKTQVLHRGIGSEPQDLDPHTVTGVTAFNVISSLIEGLVTPDHRDPNLTPKPGVAERWMISSNELVYTFYLRSNARWSNGDPVTAEDFVFSYKRALSPNLGNVYAYMLFCVQNAELFNKGEISDFSKVGIKALDEHTLEITLRAPTKYFLSLLNHHSWFPVHPGTILKHGEMDQLGSRWTKPGNYVGNGPFVLKSWEPDKKIVVTKNPLYWDADTVRLNEIHFYPIGDHKVEERSFLAGQLHLTETIPLHRIDHYREKKPEILRLDPYLGTYYYLFNVNKPPLDNVKVRRALAMAINRDELVKYITKGGEEPAYFFTPPNIGGYTSSARIDGGPEEARKLLAEAGYPNGEGFPRLELLYNTSDSHQKIAEVIHQMWKTQLNIDIQLMNMEWKVYLAATQEKRYFVARAGWIGDYIDPNTFLDMWITGRGNNRAGWSNAEYDRLLEEASKELDQDKRYRILQAAEKILIDEMPIIPLYFYRSKTLLHPAVKEWNPTLLDIHPYKYVYLQAD